METMLFFGQFLVDLLLALAKAALGLAFMLLFCLLFARHKEQKLGLACARFLTKALLVLSLAGPLSTLGSFLLFVLQFSKSSNVWQWPSLLSPAVLPYTVNVALWLCVPVLSLWLGTQLRKQDRVKGQAIISSALLFCLCFASFFCLSWPFAGLPAGLTSGQAFAAIMIHTWHLAYFSLLPASIALLAQVSICTRALAASQQSPQTISLVRRWLAGFGLVGAIPHCLNVWAVCAGYLMRAGQVPPTIFRNLLENAVLTVVLVALTLAVIHKWPQKTAFFEGCAVLCYIGFLAIPSLMAFLRTS